MKNSFRELSPCRRGAHFAFHMSNSLLALSSGKKTAAHVLDPSTPSFKPTKAWRVYTTTSQMSQHTNSISGGLAISYLSSFLSGNIFRIPTLLSLTTCPIYLQDCQELMHGRQAILLVHPKPRLWWKIGLKIRERVDGNEWASFLASLYPTSLTLKYRGRKHYSTSYGPFGHRTHGFPAHKKSPQTSPCQSWMCFAHTCKGNDSRTTFMSSSLFMQLD